MQLEEALAVFKKWLVLPDTAVFELVMAAYVAHHLPGDPVWLMLVGPPSSGKSEALRSLVGLPDVYPWSDTTKAGLLTKPSTRRGTSGGGGLLNEISRKGGSGVITASDFGTIFNHAAESVREVLQALRDLFDGHWIRRTGASHGDVQVFKGKLTFLAAVTEVVDEHARVLADMGHRFVFFRMPVLTDEQRIEQALQSIRNSGREHEMRLELQRAAHGLIERAQVARPVELCEVDQHRIACMADLATRCRSGVVRSGRDRQVEVVPETEAPGRVPKQLAQLWRAMRALGMTSERVFELLARVALDSIPKDRRLIIESLVDLPVNRPLTTDEIAERLGYPEAVVRRALEDLRAHGVLNREGRAGRETWHATPWLVARSDIVVGRVRAESEQQSQLPIIIQPTASPSLDSDGATR